MVQAGMGAFVYHIYYAAPYIPLENFLLRQLHHILYFPIGISYLYPQVIQIFPCKQVVVAREKMAETKWRYSSGFVQK